jgi:hypothetical protein
MTIPLPLDSISLWITAPFQLNFSSQTPVQKSLGCPSCLSYNPFAWTEYNCSFEKYAAYNADYFLMF